jgi:hypothetical protein
VPYLLETRDEPLALDTAPVAAPRKNARESDYSISLPFATLPPFRLVLTTALRVFQREVSLGAERAADAPPRSPAVRLVQQQSWAHSDPESPPPPLVFNVPAVGVARLLLSVDEGDNSPLPLGRAQLLLPGYRLRFFREGGAALTLLYGRGDLAAPRYDLALLTPRLVGAAADEVALGPEQTAPSPPDPEAQQARLFWVALVGAVLVLLIIIGRLVKKAA